MKRIWWALSILLIPVLSIIIFLLTRTFNGQVESIQFQSDIELEGVLVKPDGPGPHPVILLLHGAGGNHQSYDKLFFKFHTNAFLKKGFAVMVYSKRSQDDVDYRYFTYHDLLDDAHAAIAFLKERNDINRKQIGVMGISESGWFTPELVSKNPEVRFVINRVSSSLNVRETIKHEVRSDATTEGFNSKEIDEVIIPLTEQIWNYYISVSKNEIPAEGEEREEINRQLAKLHQDDHFSNWFGAGQLMPYDSILYRSRAMRYSYDPTIFLNKIDVPMLYIMAGKDKNIPTEKVIQHLQVLKGQGKNLSIKLYPEASHYLYKFGLEDGPFEGWLYYDDYLDVLTDWAVEQVREK